MKKRIINFIKRRWLLVWIMVALIGTMCFVGYAEYQTENSYMKRVVVASSDQGMMFSSNYLVEGGYNTYQAKYDRKNDDESYDVNVFLWNYSLKNTSICYPDAIEYTVELRITDNKGNAITDSSIFADIDTESPENSVYRSIAVKRQNGSEIVTYNYKSDLSSVYTFNDTIAAGNGAAKQTQYILTFNNWDLIENKNICIQMIAKPNVTKHKELRNIGAVIGMKEAVDEESNDWQASISEIQNNRTDVDGYNLVLSGSGKAKIEIKWDTSKIDINKYFRETDTIYSFYTGDINERVIDPVDDETGWRKMTINADANSYRNRYNIQLYLCAGEKPASSVFFADEDSAGASTWITYKITKISD